MVSKNNVQCGYLKIVKFFRPINPEVSSKVWKIGGLATTEIVVSLPNLKKKIK